MSALQLAPSVAERPGALDRLEGFCDPGSLTLLRTRVLSGHMGDRAAEGDGVVAGTGTVDGRPVCCFAQDPGFAGGSLGAAHADTIVRLLEHAGRCRMPVVSFVESAGARVQEGLEGLSGYARIFRAHVALSGRVPQISVVCGPSAGGGSYAPALTDFVVMTGRASMFLTGPAVVAEVTGEEVTMSDLGGPGVHTRNGVCHLTASDEAHAALLARELLDHLPGHGGAPAPMRPARPAPGSDPGGVLPHAHRSVYDVRDVVSALVDEGRVLEIAPRWARNMMCGLARLEGRAVGIVANQPRYLGGVIDADAAQKAARFVRTCNLYGLPLVVLVDTPGFLPGTAQERAGVIRHGAKLVHAFAEATVPRVTVVLRKAFGGAFIAMNAKDLGADLVFAWPTAQLGVMGPEQAAGIAYRREIAAAADPMAERARRGRRFAREHMSAAGAARSGHVDEVIVPSQTRDRLATALRCLEGAAAPDRAGGNLPL